MKSDEHGWDLFNLRRSGERADGVARGYSAGSYLRELRRYGGFVWPRDRNETGSVSAVDFDHHVDAP